MILSRSSISSARMIKQWIQYPFQVIISATTQSPKDVPIMRTVDSDVSTGFVDQIGIV